MATSRPKLELVETARYSIARRLRSITPVSHTVQAGDLVLVDKVKSCMALTWSFEQIMQSRIFSVEIILALTLLMVLPSAYIRMNSAQAFSTWLPFGPQSDKLILQYYSDFQTMFNA